VHCRKFSDIATSEQCVFCQLILNGILRARGDYRIQSEDVIYFAKYLYSDASAPQAGSCAEYPLEIQAPYNRRRLVNHLCVSTASSRSHISRDQIHFVSKFETLYPYRKIDVTLSMEDEENQKHSLLGRPMGKTFDIKLGTRWIRECKENHGTECLERCTAFRPSRILNNKRKCLEYTPPSCSYVALSYKWPVKPCLKLTAATADRLEKPGGLEELKNEVAPVVRDVIELADKLGYTYVWVDALCIPQQEDGDSGSCLALEREAQLPSMTKIYINAAVTIVACSEDPEKGLPGFQVERSPQLTAQAGGMTLAIRKDDLSEAVKHSPWYHRGWTFQEGAVPHRLLIFTEDQVFFMCNKAMHREDA
jgi:hypothetical protein